MRSNILDKAFSQIDRDAFEPFVHKNILVTGATGLVGSLLVKAFSYANEAYGASVAIYAVVRNKTKAVSVLDGYLSNEVNLVKQDLSKTLTAELPKIDYIVHAAAITQSKIMVQRPVEVIKTSLVSTQELLRLAQADSAKMLYISSMEYYGTLPKDTLATEDKLGYIDLSSARSCYPESKRMCECMCNAYAQQFGVDVCSARLAQTFGAGVLEGENRAFMQFLRSALANENITLKTSGLSETNYVNSIDAIKAILTLLASGVSGGAYNVVNEETHSTIRDVAQLVIDKFSNGTSRLVFDIDMKNTSGYAADVKLKLCANKLETLGWSPQYGLIDSFKQLQCYINEQQANG